MKINESMTTLLYINIYMKNALLDLNNMKIFMYWTLYLVGFRKIFMARNEIKSISRATCLTAEVLAVKKPSICTRCSIFVSN